MRSSSRALVLRARYSCVELEQVYLHEICLAIILVPGSSKQRCVYSLLRSQFPPCWLTQSKLACQTNRPYSYMSVYTLIKLKSACTHLQFISHDRVFVRSLMLYYVTTYKSIVSSAFWLLWLNIQAEHELLLKSSVIDFLCIGHRQHWISWRCI